MASTPHTRQTAPLADPQSRPPATRIGLSRVGITGLERVVRVSAGGDDQPYHVELECFVDLDAERAGVHMSRFPERVTEVIDEAIVAEAFRVDALAAHVAERVLSSQDGRRAEVTIRARYPEYKLTPVTEKPTQELYLLTGTAVSSEFGVRRVLGVQAQGITACPCAQELVAEAAHGRLVEEGFTEEEVERVFAAVPVATHNQRGIGTLAVGRLESSTVELEAERLVRIVESSMSAEIFELLKRPDERAVVEKAHRRPRFVEDCVREMLRGVIEAYPDLEDATYLSARQENLETIHQHSVVAERHGLLEDLRAEIERGVRPARSSTLRDWLDQAA